MSTEKSLNVNIKCERDDISLPHLFFIWSISRKMADGGDDLSKIYRYIVYADRQKIEHMWADGKRVEDIAAEIRVHIATIYKELQRGWDGTVDKNQRQTYSAALAEQKVQASFKRRGRRAV